MEKERGDFKAIIKYAGAFIAWIVGSGFATGQEILQFFTSYGYASYGAVLINMVGFVFLGQKLLVKGYEHKGEAKFDHYRFYCGKWAGAVYSRLVPATLLLVMTVLITASGATLSEYYGVNSSIGSATMAILVLCAYLTGFENLVRIVSKIGPVIVVFAIAVGAATVIHDLANFSEISDYEKVLAPSQVAPGWAASGALYLSLNFLCGCTYFTALGKTAKSRSDAKWGALLGTAALVLVIAIMNTAILLNAGDAASLSVPTLFLSKKISPLLGTSFSVVLMLGMFSSSSAIMWSFCNQFFTEGTWKNRLFAVATAAFSFVAGLFFSFRELVGIVYPFIGYLGLVFTVCVIFRHNRT
ncbi:MAG: hypothetical protein FWG53_11370 [Clostridiales bacterium]|nr:hypothetical protein [Clostridiales bacterium]